MNVELLADLPIWLLTLDILVQDLEMSPQERNLQLRDVCKKLVSTSVHSIDQVHCREWQCHQQNAGKHG